MFDTIKKIFVGVFSVAIIILLIFLCYFILKILGWYILLIPAAAFVLWLFYLLGDHILKEPKTKEDLEYERACETIDNLRKRN